MRVLIDSNILFSAVYSRWSVPYQAYKKAVEPPYQCLVCEQSLVELRRAFARKIPSKTEALERFIESMLTVVELVPVPLSKHHDEGMIRDIDDRPILRAAIESGVTILISGDKDFLESGLDKPKIMTAAEFVDSANNE
jgi:putative PIN family toxin of toxin-antitoxin system